MSQLPATLSKMPLVGRAAELDLFRHLLDTAGAGVSSTLFLAGDGGIGKTRLTAAAREEAERRGWGIVIGRAYPVETGIPYALFADALLPALRALEPETRTLLTRGVEDELASLFPTLAAPEQRRRPANTDEPGDFKNRLLWNFTQFLKHYTARTPLLIILEDLQWADASSLELLHFIARQMREDRLLLLCTYKSEARSENAVLRATEQSLVSLSVARVQAIGPLARTDTDELIRQIFNTDVSVIREFAALLYGWTRGNPFFIQETLKTLVLAGRLRQEGGRWLGWDVDAFELPPSVKDAVLLLTDRLSAAARAVAELAAVIGTRTTFDVLATVSGYNDTELLAAIEELVRQHVLVEQVADTELSYDFAHPLIRETLYTQSGTTRTRMLHAAVGQALEQHYGPAAERRSDELAYHFSRAHSRALMTKAARYLASAGRNALAKHANREASSYLGAALDCVQDGHTVEGEDAGSLLFDLARARQRLGDYDGAAALLERARRAAEEAGDRARAAAIERRLGLACFWTGRPAEALRHYDAGIIAADEAGDPTVRIRLAIAKGMCLQELGQAVAAKAEVQHALVLAESAGPELLGRVHRALQLLYVWTGPSELAREHGQRAIDSAVATGDRTLAFSAHWAMAMLEGLNGNEPGILRHLGETARIAEELNSPVLRAWVAELEIEYAAATGDWERGIAVGEQAIAVARALNQHILIPRLLVWTGLIYLGRNEIDRGKQYVDEAWALSGAGSLGDRPANVHIVVPAHIGRAGYHLAIGEYTEAIRIGEAGLEIADRSGYVMWAIHKLLPIVAEANLWLGDLEESKRLGARLREHSSKLDHRLGLAWADACDALVTWLAGDLQGGVILLRTAVEKLEAVPYMPDAARIRRLLAGRLADLGERESALHELRIAHDLLSRIGAERDLAKTRDQFRELGARPPARTVGEGAAGLTRRELEIARLVSARKSNKAIGRALGISARTVSTHLSNIFVKLGISSRGELVDYLRTHEFTG